MKQYPFATFTAVTIALLALGMLFAVIAMSPNAGGGHCPAGMDVAYKTTEIRYTDTQGEERLRPAIHATCKEIS